MNTTSKILATAGLILLFLVFSSCNQASEDKIQSQQVEIDNLREENRRLKEGNNSYVPDSPTGISDEHGNSANNIYFHLTDNQLNEAFKNYMSDSYFSFEGYTVKGKTIRVNAGIVMNTTIRALQRENQSIFDELLKRYNKIVFWDQFGKSITIKRIEE
jgi:hypothetical protein